jgi:hypothetical protein
MTSKLSNVALAAFAVLLGGCQPSDPPPDLVKTQREALNKAKAVEGLLQQQAQESKQAADEAAK